MLFRRGRIPVAVSDDGRPVLPKGVTAAPMDPLQYITYCGGLGGCTEALAMELFSKTFNVSVDMTMQKLLLSV